MKKIRPDSDFENSKDFIEDFLLDSFDIVNLSGELEKTFSIRITGDDIIPENFISVTSISGMVERLKER